jgi:hypothetical protein
MGRLGYERLVSHFSLDQNVAQTMAVYDKVLAARNAN